MDITLKKISISHANSEETFCYSADIYVDGKKAFSARNSGHGGCDIYHPYPGYTGPSVEKVDAWLKANKPIDNTHGIPIEHSLEIEVGEQLNAHVAKQERARIERSFARLLAKNVCSLSDEGFFQFKAPPTPANIAAIRARKPGIVIVNDADEATKQKALKAYCPNLD